METLSQQQMQYEALGYSSVCQQLDPGLEPLMCAGKHSSSHTNHLGVSSPVTPALLQEQWLAPARDSPIPWDAASLNPLHEPATRTKLQDANTVSGRQQLSEPAAVGTTLQTTSGKSVSSCQLQRFGASTSTHLAGSDSEPHDAAAASTSVPADTQLLDPILAHIAAYGFEFQATAVDQHILLSEGYKSAMGLLSCGSLLCQPGSARPSYSLNVFSSSMPPQFGSHTCSNHMAFFTMSLLQSLADRQVAQLLAGSGFTGVANSLEQTAALQYWEQVAGDPPVISLVQSQEGSVQLSMSSKYVLKHSGGVLPPAAAVLDVEEQQGANCLQHQLGRLSDLDVPLPPSGCVSIHIDSMDKRLLGVCHVL